MVQNNGQTSLDQAPAAEPEQPAAAKPPTTYAVRARVVGEKGFEIEIEVRDLRFKGMVDAATTARTFENQLERIGFKPVERAPPVVVSAPGVSPSAGGGGDYADKVFESCPECGGPVYDNREKKRSGEMKAGAPWFSCKDRDGCGWAKWPRGGGGRRR